MQEQAMASMESSLWSSMASWLTPTTLFLFLNLTIGTIFISSKLQKQQSNPENNHHHDNNTQDQQQNPGFGRSPSNVLYRLKSFNFNNNNNNNNNNNYNNNLVRTPSNLLYKLKSFNFSNNNNNNNKPQEEEEVTYQEQEPEPTLSRSPSNFLYKLKSFNFSNNNNNKPQEEDDDVTYQEQEPEPTLTRSPSLLHRLKSMKIYNPLVVVSASPPPPATQETVTHFEAESSSDDDEERDDMLEDLDDISIEEVYSKLRGNTQQQPPVTRTKSDTKPASGEVPTKLPKKLKKSASTKSAFSHFHESDIVAVEARRPATTREGQNVKKSGDDDDQEVDAKADDFINRFKQHLKLQRMDSIIRYKEMFGGAPAK